VGAFSGTHLLPLGRGTPRIGGKPEDQDGMLKVPDGPGIGVTPVEPAIKENRMPGEPYWD